MGGQSSKIDGRNGKKKHGVFETIQNLNDTMEEGQKLFRTISILVPQVKVAAKHLAYFTSFNSFVAAAGVTAELIQVYQGFQIIAELQGIRQQITAQTALQAPKLFAVNAHEYIILKMHEFKDVENHWFFLYHPDNDWHAAFFSRVRDAPLPSNFFGLSDNLDALCLLMRYLRAVLLKMTKKSGKGVVFHVLMPTYYPWHIEKPMKFAAVLQPLHLHGVTHQQQRLVALNLPGVDPDSIELDGVGVWKRSLSWPEKIFGRREERPRVLGVVSGKEAVPDVEVTEDMRRVYRRSRHS